MKSNLVTLALLFAAMTQHAVPSMAAESDNIKFVGKLVEPPACTFNGGKPIEVNFGEVRTDKIDGTNFKKTVDYGLKCERADGKVLKLSLTGGASGFDPTVLATSVTDLGIKLFLDDTVLEVNKSRDLTYPKTPVLTVVPVKKDKANLKGGDFNASGNLKIEYI
ncbi:fimbrial protein [Pseudomonas sp. zfem005]|uniref:fimbrial protein n=1 Tax=Pseudomonas sp. zfem005 TaxID=3078200 RepID=UPI0029293392|nr:fimbrial protein [Pseudomonas sp. zfem005]MDU9414385.1 fimbrial protein [Pseudomonas sp. zfem005]